MFSTLKKFCCFKREPKTPLGFCDGPINKKASFYCCGCSLQDKYGQSYDPDNKFHEAVCMGKIRVVLHLLSKKRFHINDQDKEKRTALHFACFYGHLHLVQFLIYNDCLINALDHQKATPLMKAVQSWETKIVSVLLDNGADPNCKNLNGETALHQAVYVDSPDIAASLIKYGAEIEETTKDGFTPLLLALRERKLLTAGCLIKNGANIHAQDDYQRTTLMYAVQCDSEAIVEQLLEKGIDHSLKDAFGWSALQYAVAGKRKVKNVIFDYADSLLLGQHNLLKGHLHADVYSSGYHFKSVSLISISSREEDEDNAENQTKITIQPRKNKCATVDCYSLPGRSTYRKDVHSYNTGNDTDNTGTCQVWADRCPHPKFRDYSHSICKPKSEQQQSQPDIDLSEELEEISDSKMENDISFNKGAEYQGFSVSNTNGLHESSTEAAHSSSLYRDVEKNVKKHIEKKSIREDKKHTSEEEEEHKTVGTRKRPS